MSEMRWDDRAKLGELRLKHQMKDGFRFNFREGGAADAFEDLIHEAALMHRRSEHRQRQFRRFAPCNRLALFVFGAIGNEKAELFSVDRKCVFSPEVGLVEIGKRYIQGEIIKPKLHRFVADELHVNAYTRVSLVNARTASLVCLRRHERLLALVTNTANESTRSIVLLNLRHNNSPAVGFYSDWPNDTSCLSYGSELSFEISIAETDIDLDHQWWRVSGVLFGMGDQIYLQAAQNEERRGGFRYINVRDGSIFDGHPSNEAWIFGVWNISIRDTLNERPIKLFEFNVHKQTER